MAVVCVGLSLSESKVLHRGSGTSDGRCGSISRIGYMGFWWASCFRDVLRAFEMCSFGDEVSGF